MTTFPATAAPATRHKAVMRLVAELSADRAPILLGPWRSEVGFEALYWLPFLRWLASQVPDFDRRAAVVTRGGLAPLYAPVAAQGYDLYALRSVTEVRRENLYDQQTTGLLKQVRPTPWDEAVLAEAASALGLGRAVHTVHPAWMYWALAPYWDEDAGLRYLQRLTDYTPLPRPRVTGSLPPRYVAVKFYDRATFPIQHPDVRDWVQRTLRILAAQCPVVLLTTPADHDDHVDLPIAGPGIIALAPDVPPEQNLLLQAAVLAHATAFVGTYGGVAQLALRLGVPALSVYHTWGGTLHAHLVLSSWLSKTTQVPFLVGSLDDAHFWQQVLMAPARPTPAAAPAPAPEVAA